MEQLLTVIVKEYGLMGLLLCFMLWRELKILGRKKSGMTYERLEERISTLDARLNEHLKGAAVRITEFEVMKATQAQTNEINERHHQKLAEWLKLIEQKIDRLFELGYANRGPQPPKV